MMASDESMLGRPGASMAPTHGATGDGAGGGPFRCGRCAGSAPTLSSVDRWREGTSLICAGWVGEFCHRPVGGEVAPACLPVWQIRVGLLPVDEGCLVAEMVQAFADAQVRFAVNKGLHRAAFLPGADAPPGVVRVGERVRAEVAV